MIHVSFPPGQMGNETQTSLASVKEISANQILSTIACDQQVQRKIHFEAQSQEKQYRNTGWNVPYYWPFFSTFGTTEQILVFIVARHFLNSALSEVNSLTPKPF